MQNQKILTVAELSTLWGIGTSPIYRYIDKGMPVVRTNPVLVDLDDALAWGEKRASYAPKQQKELTRIVREAREKSALQSANDSQ